jgi:hypothetical protein
MIIPHQRLNFLATSGVVFSPESRLYLAKRTTYLAVSQTVEIYHMLKGDTNKLGKQVLPLLRRALDIIELLWVIERKITQLGFSVVFKLAS